MSKRRISGSASGTGRTSAKAKIKNKPKLKIRAEAPKFVRFLGLSLSGGKADKSCLAVVDFYETEGRLFLNRLVDRVRAEEFISADHKLHELILQFSENARWLLMDVPLTLPPCLPCQLQCPGYETCNQPEVKWMRKMYQRSEKPKPKKMFTPYTQRPLDMYLQMQEGGIFEVQHALGSNLAPLTARAQFIKRRLELPTFEVFPKLAVWRLGLQLKVGKTQLKVYRNSVGGDEARRIFLNTLAEKTGIFFYNHDLKLMIENFHAFEAFICAYMGYLKHLGRTQPRPADFPAREGWVEIPMETDPK